ncbi:hypothetical protein PspKH34_18420 [Parageobacillus sp. KH3-4]|nr:hypothetical protein PspKH34_18420 [Parageobacillus sp. KH3-4]
MSFILIIFDTGSYCSNQGYKTVVKSSLECGNTGKRKGGESLPTYELLSPARRAFKISFTSSVSH